MPDRSLIHVAQVHDTAFTREEIEAFEDRIHDNPTANEFEASHFLGRYPKFLFLGQGDRVRREVALLNPDGSPRFRADFFRRRIGGPYWDIIELKSPSDPFLRRNPRHPALGPKVIVAMTQAEDYRDLLLRDEDEKMRLLRQGICICRPRILVVVGKRVASDDLERFEVLRDRVRRGPIEAWTYTDLLDFAKDCYRSLGMLVLPLNVKPFVSEIDFAGVRRSLLDYPISLDTLDSITPSMVETARRLWTKSEPTAVPSVRRLQVDSSYVYFYLGPVSDARSLFGEYLTWPPRMPPDEPLVLVLGMRPCNINKASLNSRL